MTFKHVKFEDSAVMRSLEKMAREKGLVTADPARVKTASAPDLGFPQSSTLMENVLRLCAGLRHAGFEKHAEEVEEKFLAFKQAQTLYETSPEKGEDLVDAAHPKGSHKLEDVAGDEAVFETIIDQHLKHLKMIDKTPTGKLANNNAILGAVKVVLSQATTEADFNKIIDDNLKIALTRWRRIHDIVDKELFHGLFQVGRGSEFSAMSSHIQDYMIERPATIDNLEELKKLIKNVGNFIKPGMVAGMGGMSLNPWGGLSKDTYNTVIDTISNMNQFIDKAYNARTEINKIHSKNLQQDDGSIGEVPKATAPAPAVDVSLQKIQNARRALSGIDSLVNADFDADANDKAQIKAWIAKVSSGLEELEKNRANKSPEDIDAVLAKLTKDFARVRQEWV